MQFHSRDLSELDDLTEEHLGFSALSDGLGFQKNPSPARQPQGTGATAAGPAMPVLNTTRATPRVSTAPITSVLQEPAASPRLRLTAFALDACIVLIPLALAWKLSLRAEALEVVRHNAGSAALLYTAILAAYFLLSESFGGQSLGKMMLNLRVVEDDKYQKPIGLAYAAARLVLLIAGIAGLGIGLLASFVDKKRRPLHDRYTGSIVRRKV
jgi:uncharacterized RDD family membrane protein YckC